MRLRITIRRALFRAARWGGGAPFLERPRSGGALSVERPPLGGAPFLERPPGAGGARPLASSAPRGGAPAPRGGAPFFRAPQGGRASSRAPPRGASPCSSGPQGGRALFRAARSAAVAPFFERPSRAHADARKRGAQCPTRGALSRLAVPRVEVKARCNFAATLFADGHTASNAPDLFRPPKLSGAGPS